MDESERRRIADRNLAQRLAEIEAAKVETEAQQINYLARLDALEANGVDIDFLIDLYGHRFLSPDRNTSSRLDQIETILQATHDPNHPTLVLGNTYPGRNIIAWDSRDNKRACMASLVLFEDASTCSFEYLRDDATGELTFAIHGVGYVVDEDKRPSMLNDDPQQVSFMLSRRRNGDKANISHNVDFVSSIPTTSDGGDDFHTLALQIRRDSAFGGGPFDHVEFGKTLDWLSMGYMPAADRKQYRQRRQK